MFHLGSLLTYWFSVLKIYSLMCVGCFSLLLLLYSCQFIPLCLLVFVLYIWILLYCVYVDKCNILSLYWSFYLYVVFYFYLCVFYFVVYFVWCEYYNSWFFVISICMKYFFHPLTFNLNVSFALKQASCRQNIVDYWFFAQTATLSFDWSIYPIDI